MQRNSSRGETLQPRSEREYLLKGLIRCPYCGLPTWVQTYTNVHRYYREQKGSRSSGYCVGRSGSILCHVPDEQTGKILEAIVLPHAWMHRALARIQLVYQVQRFQQERVQTEQRLRRLGKVYVDGLYAEEKYRR